MATELCIKRLVTERRIYEQRKDYDHVIIEFNDENIMEIYFVIHNLEYPYVGGVYMGKCIFENKYPMKAPTVMLMTPSGRYETNTEICTTMTNFYNNNTRKSDWIPAINHQNFILSLVSNMLIPNDIGVGHLTDSLEKKYELAIKSMDFNLKNKTFLQYFGKHVEFLEKSRKEKIEKYENEKLNKIV